MDIHEMVDVWIKEMEAAGLDYDDMLEVIKIAKQKFDRIKAEVVSEVNSEQ